jgi:hypothetical protein
MTLNLTFHLGALQSNLTRLEAGDLNWLRNFGSPRRKNVLARLAIGTAAIWYETDQPKTEDELESR